MSPLLAVKQYCDQPDKEELKQKKEESARPDREQRARQAERTDVDVGDEDGEYAGGHALVPWFTCTRKGCIVRDYAESGFGHVCWIPGDPEPAPSRHFPFKTEEEKEQARRSEKEWLEAPKMKW